jgi:hypothetical protein
MERKDYIGEKDLEKKKKEKEKNFLYPNFYTPFYTSTILTNLTVIQFKFERKIKKTRITYLTRLNENSNDISLIFDSYHLCYISLES